MANSEKKNMESWAVIDAIDKYYTSLFYNSVSAYRGSGAPSCAYMDALLADFREYIIDYIDIKTESYKKFLQCPKD